MSVASDTIGAYERRTTEAKMDKKYRRVYALLKQSGHMPAKAVEILIDAKRGDQLALYWIRGMRALRWRYLRQSVQNSKLHRA
jgi:hypothetical protein